MMLFFGIFFISKKHWSDGCPIVGSRLSDGVPQPDKQQTISYSVPRKRLTDNKWVFPQTSGLFSSAMSVGQISTFNSNYPHTVENHSSVWFEPPAVSL